MKVTSFGAKIITLKRWSVDIKSLSKSLICRRRAGCNLTLKRLKRKACNDTLWRKILTEIVRALSLSPVKRCRKSRSDVIFSLCSSVVMCVTVCVSDTTLFLSCDVISVALRSVLPVYQSHKLIPQPCCHFNIFFFCHRNTSDQWSPRQGNSWRTRKTQHVTYS